MSKTVFDSRIRRTGLAKHISWGAILAGVVVVLITQLTLSLLGLSFGAGSIEPLLEKHPFKGLGIGSGIWLGITFFAAMFLGGWVSARFAAMSSRTESVLHGVVTWGLVSIIMTYFITTTISGIISGAAGVIGKTASVMGQGATLMAPEISKAVSQIKEDGFGLNEVKKEAELLLRQSKKLALHPKAIEHETNAITKDVKSAAADIANTPQALDNELSALWEKLEARSDKLIEAVDQEAFVNILVARTEMTQAEAKATVAKWNKTLNDAKTKFTQVKAQAEQQLRETGDATAEAVSKAAAWSFVGLMIGLIAAAAGGYLGTPRGRLFLSSHQQDTIITEESAA